MAKNGKPKLVEIDPAAVNAAELVVYEPGSSGDVVKQQKLKHFAAVRDAYVAMRTKYYDEYELVKDLLQNGADVQTGKLGVKQGVKYVRRRSYKQDIIDLKGEQFQIRLLESTEAHAEFYWRLTRRK